MSQINLPGGSKWLGAGNQICRPGELGANCQSLEILFPMTIYLIVTYVGHVIPSSPGVGLVPLNDLSLNCLPDSHNPFANLQAFPNLIAMSNIAI